MNGWKLTEYRLFMYLFMTMMCSLKDSSFPTRDRTHALCNGNTGSKII